MRRTTRRIVAGLGYVLGALLLLSGLAGGIPASVVFGLTIVLLTMLATNVGGLRRRLPLFNSPNRIKALGAWGGLVLTGLVAVVASPSPPATQRAGLAPTSASSPTAIAAVPTATVAPATAAPTVTTAPATSTAAPTAAVAEAAAPTAPPRAEPTQPPPPAANTAPPATAKPAPPAPTPTSAPTAQPKPTQPPPPTVAPVAKPAAKVDAGTAAISAGHGIAPRNRACPESHSIKGNVEGRQAGRAEDPIYHVRGQSRTYGQTIPEVCFATIDAARQAGFRPPR